MLHTQLIRRDLICFCFQFLLLLIKFPARIERREYDKVIRCKFLVTDIAVREIAKTVYIVTSSKWRRCFRLLESRCYGPFSCLAF